MPRTLVVYFSRTGTTKAIAERLARSLDAELDVITEPRSRKGPLGWLRSGFDATFEREAVIKPPAHHPAGFDLVVIGTPIWNASLSTPVRTYLKLHRGDFKAVAFFLTCGGRGEANVLAQMTEVAGKLPLGTLAIRAQDLTAPNLGQRLDAFTAKLTHVERKLAAPAA